MTLEAGDVALLPFPYTNLQGTKRRPTLVLTGAEYNDASTDVLVAYVTSQPQTGPWSLPITQRDLAEGTIPRASWVRVDKIATIEQALVQKVAGRLEGRAMARVQERLSALLVHAR